MKIAVCADIHDNIWALTRALPLMQNAAVLICCGDLCAPFTLVQMAEGFKGPIHVVWGNNDGDKWLLTQQAARFPQVVLHGELAELDLGGFRVAVNHYPQIARGLASSGKYELVCYGHDHRTCDEVLEGCRLLNPGELMGRLGPPGFAFYDRAAGAVQPVLV
ncbi:MAG: metallophosphoesterase family protein [Candidatus Handelsmanbacteria bacterium]|nr:metallophosphoesterase family protein [Candidatus Handelsmanbacteria bacterium]